MSNIKRIQISKEDILKILSTKNNPFKKGGFGILAPFSNDTLIKIYYGEIFNTYDTLDENELDNELYINLILKEKDIEDKWDFNRERELLELCDRLSETSSRDLIKGIVYYGDYVIGVVMEWYKGYDTLYNIFNDLSIVQKLQVLKRTRELFVELMDNDIYPTDIAEENVLVNPKTLDVKLIDLDDPLTIIGDKEKSDISSIVRYDCENAFNTMEDFLIKRYTLK